MAGLFAVHDPTAGWVTWCQNLTGRVGSGRVKRLSNLVGRVRSGQEFFKSHGSGWVKNFSKSHGSGWVGSRGDEKLTGRVRS